VDVLLLLLLGDERRLVLGESSADGTGLLGSEVEGKVPVRLLEVSWFGEEFSLDALLALVEEPQLGALVGVDDGKDLSDTLADVMDAGELGGGASGNLGSPERDQLPCACQYPVPFSFVCVATYDLRSAS
jgi:hypothetical protein